MPVRALIFDLDDTLIDTHGQLVQEAHWQACLAMHTAGLDVPPTELMQTRQRFLLSHPREEINELLANHYGFSCKTIVKAGFDAYFNPVFSELELFPETRPLLEKWAHNYPLYLVTSGYEQAQKRKVELLGIESLFKAIYYVDIARLKGKQETFAQILSELGGPAEDLWVVGDRITNEIVAGNNLGLTTVWLCQGECAHILPQTEQEKPVFTLTQIHDLDLLLPLQVVSNT
jgi:HAD superfamily hydrolase (TIGR01549 family)